MGYMWKGRFKEGAGRETMDFTSSIAIDKRLAPYDIRGSKAHVSMLVKCGIIEKSEGEEISVALEQIEEEISRGDFVFKETDEDIHTAVERRLIELTGKAGGKLHTARSRNDQIVLDEKLFIMEEIGILLEETEALQKAFLAKSREVYPHIMPSYTHLQQGQPILISHYLLAYMEMLSRDSERLRDAYKRTDSFPAGMCACAGTSLPIDRKYMADMLGFSKVSANSLDTVSDRDFILEFANACIILLLHLSRFAEDMIIWNTEEFKFIDIPDKFCTGSSIMPQKKNPDVLELIRGKTATSIGLLTGLYALIKGLPLSYNRDLQEDKEPLFKILDTLHPALLLLGDMVSRMVFLYDNIESSMNEMLITTDIAECLVEKGVPFREAHGICGRLVRYCIESGKGFSELSSEEWSGLSEKFPEDIKSKLDMRCSVDSKKSPGGTSPSEVKKEIVRWEKILK